MNFGQLINHFIDYFHQLSRTHRLLIALVSLLLAGASYKKEPLTRASHKSLLREGDSYDQKPSDRAAATPYTDLRRHNLSPYFHSTEKDRKYHKTDVRKFD